MNLKSSFQFLMSQNIFSKLYNQTVVTMSHSAQKPREYTISINVSVTKCVLGQNHQNCSFQVCLSSNVATWSFDRTLSEFQQLDAQVSLLCTWSHQYVQTVVCALYQVDVHPVSSCGAMTFCALSNYLDALPIFLALALTQLPHSKLWSNNIYGDCYEERTFSSVHRFSLLSSHHAV